MADARGRWERMLENNDHAKLWQAINWGGELTECDNSNKSKPSDDTFKTYFEEIFNPPNTEYLDVNELFTQITIPVLDQPISPAAIEVQIKKKWRLIKPVTHIVCHQFCLSGYLLITTVLNTLYD